MAIAFVKIPGYRTTEELYNGLRTLVYRGYREIDDQPVVIKLLKNPYPSFSELLSFRQQYTIAKNLNSPLIVQTYSLEPYQNSYALVMEDFGGISLKAWKLRGKGEFIQAFLEIAIALCNTLEILYRERIIHKDIKPANILINPETQQIKLIDFSIASLLPRETQTLVNPNVLEGTLAYISPEQTGRMNRGIDYRTDFYSLGVTFYELLAGKLPFESNDPMELVHSHIAKIAPLVHKINSEIPSVLSEIVNKLMAKNAKKRYQSALGLKFDLEKCLHQLQVTGSIERFEIASRDVCDRFLIPEKLYGRESEVQTLLEAFDRIADGTSEMMLVAGFSGIGKTAVVNEVHKPIVRQRGYFIKGKFDQFNRNIPFSAFVQAFRDLMGQLLSESDAQILSYKTKILGALGDNAQVIVEVIPELERVIGSQPPAPELSGTAAQNRFNLLFQKFITVFTTKEQPLVMFLDDLQWADSASLTLIQLLVGESQTGYLLLIGAYRDNEVYPLHPLILTLDEVGKTRATVNTIMLQPLSKTDLNQLVADTLTCSATLAQPLTELVYQKTRGNPFFSTQFLKALHQDGLITFDVEMGHWQCDITLVRAAALTDNVVEFMAIQLQKLPTETQEVLKLAACIGNSFDLSTLAIVSEQTLFNAAAALWKALQEGLVLPQSEIYKFYASNEQQDRNAATGENVTYRFLHDRVQQAAYSLIPDDQKQTTHLKIGTLLLQNSSETQRQEKIFDIVGHFNLAAELIVEPQACYEFAKLNLQAGKAARASAAFDAALIFVSKGIERLPTTKWQDNYLLTLALYDLAGELAYLCSQFEQSDRLIALILENAKNSLDKVSAYETQILAFLAQGQPQDGIYTAIEVLGLFGIRLPKHPNQAQVLLGLAKTKLILGNKKPEELVNLPNMTDANKLAAMRILSSAASAAYLCAPKLMPLLVFERVNLSVRHGNTALSAFGYAWYGLILCGILMDIEGGYQFGQLALQLLERFNATDLRAKVLFMTYTFISHWRDRITDTMPALLTAYQSGLETGDVEYAAWAALVHSYNRYWTGESLIEAEVEIRSLIEAIAPFNQKNGLLYIQIYHQATLNLLGHASDPSCLSGESYQVAEDIPAQIAASDRTGLFFSYVCQQHLHYLFGQYDAAIEKSNAAKPYFENCVSSLPTVLHYFYDSLAQLAIYTTATSKERQQILKSIQTNQQKLKKWGFYAPMNYQHKFLLVEAERYRVLGQKLEAQEYYDRAIQVAKENQFLNEEALGNELAAKFYLDWGKEKVSASYMQDAYYGYAKWGAKAKTDDLEKRYPDLLRPILQQVEQSLNPLESLASIASPTLSIHSSTRTTHSSSTSINTALDFAAILQAYQALSSAIQLDELLHQLTQIILQNSGGDRCTLIVSNSEGEWQLRAIATPEQTELCSEPLDDNPNLPVKLIQYVKNTQKVVVIDDLKTDLPVIEAYLNHQQPKSVLGLPILDRGQLRGILYLENRSTSGVFTKSRILILNFLCTQAAISLENARLYHQAQTYAQQLEHSQLQIVQSEKMASLGNLVAGIAHEINNPLGFLNGSINNAKDYVQDLVGHIELYQQHYPDAATPIQDNAEDIDLEFLIEDLPKLLDSMSGATDRIKSISTSLRIFSRADTDSKVSANIHEGLDSTLLILKYRLKANEHRSAIAVIKEYGELPQILGFPGQLNQVFMNILANAIDMFDEMAQNESFAFIQANPQQITIRTEFISNLVKIGIRDNGMGIKETVKAKIFDHLFTTKTVGKGTGLGLAIARQIVVEKHGGSLNVNSTLGQGTEFTIALPT